ncbi:MAG: hypothetical protein ACK5U8_07540, partial [Deltaproteobacteria bacterium]
MRSLVFGAVRRALASSLVVAGFAAVAHAQDGLAFFTESDAVRGAIAGAVRSGDGRGALAAIDALPEDARGRADVVVARVRAAAAIDRHDEVARDLARHDERLPTALQPWAAETRARALLFL